MPISLQKAAEIIGLNIMEAGKRMPPDVKDSLYVGLECIRLVTALRTGVDACVMDKLEHEEGYNPPIFPDDHDHPGGD